MREKRLACLFSIGVILVVIWAGCREEAPVSPASPGPASAASKVWTVEELASQGAEPLSTEEIRELLVGRTLRVTDLRSGAKSEVFFGRDGKRTVLGATSSAVTRAQPREAVPFEIRDGRVYSTLPDGSESVGAVYRLGDRYFAVLSEEGGIVGYEMVGSLEGRMTIESLEASGGEPLNTEELQELLVGRTITVRHLVGGEIFEISYSPEGIRTVAMPGEEEILRSRYHIADGKLEIDEDGYQFSARIYRLGDQIFGARSIEEGFVSYEILSSRKN